MPLPLATKSDHSMTNLKIIVEGDSDVRFLEDFIEFHFNKRVSRETFIVAGGKTEKLHEIQPAVTGRKNILIFDADDKNYKSTLKNVQAECKRLKLSINGFFLFPNNESTGNLETLLLGCIPTQNKILLKCIEDYQKCKISSDLVNLNEIDSKEIFYIYHGSFDNKKFGAAKPTIRKYVPELWNLKAPITKTLQDFLTPYFT